MQKWEIDFFVIPVNQVCSRIWTEKGSDGLSSYEKINKLAEDGWELISVTPVSGMFAGRTSEILFTFRRPIP